MPATIFNSSKVKALKETLSLNGGADVISSTTDPTAVAVDALRGSLLLNTSNGEIYRKLDDGSTTNWQIVGSSGASGINYIENPIAEANTAGWATYADAAASRPVDGTGGSANVTWTRTTSSPLRGIGSFLFTKDAANRQGQGVSYDLTIDAADQARVLQISFDYEIASGTYSGGTPSTDSDLIVYFYRTTATGRLIEPSVIKLDGGVSGVKYSYRGEIQADSDATGYRLIIHVATTSASAYTVKMDNFVVGPSKNVAGSITTSPVSYTPTLTTSGGGNITLNATGQIAPNGWWRRNGEFLEGQISFRNGSGGGATGTAGTVRVGLPTGLTPNTSKMATTAAGLRADGHASLGTTSDVEATVFVDISGYITFYFQGGANLLAVSDLAANYIVTASFRYPVSGWGATATLGQDADTRVVSLRVGTTGAPTGTVASSIGSSTTIQFNNVTNDTHGGYVAATGYTVPVGGWYQIHAQQAISHASVAVNQEAVMGLYVNGVLVSTGPTTKFQSTGVVIYYPSMDDTRLLKAGDIVTVRVSSTGTTPVTASDSNGNNLIINRISGPAQVAASEVIACKLRLPSNQAVSGSSATLDLSTVVFDSHGGADTANDRYRVPAPGYYRVSCGIIGSSLTSGSIVQILITVNGTSRCTRSQFAVSTGEVCVVAEDVFLLNSGDLVAVTVGSTDTSWTVTGGTEADSSFAIQRIGGI